MHFLSLPDKLLHLTRICRTFPRLSSESFAYDTLVWTPTLITQLSRSPPPPLLSLLSRVPSALYVGDCGSSLRSLCSLLSPPGPPSPFPALRAVTLEPMRSRGGVNGRTFRCLIDTLRLCPHLDALHINLYWLSVVSLSPLLSPLPLLPCLRTLSLQVKCTKAELLLVLSLPHLTALNLLMTDVAISTPPPHPFPPLPPLRIFLPPLIQDGRNTSLRTTSTQWQQALLSSLTTSQEGAELRLERLLLVADCASHLRFIPLFRRLQTLQLTVPGEKDATGELATLYSSLIACPLPLRHLRLQHDLTGRGHDQTDARLRTVLPALVSAYAARLVCLEVDLHRYWEERGREVERDAVMNISGVRDAEAMTAALLSCHSLRRLHITNWWLSPSASPPSPALPQLESLHVEVTSTEGIDETTLAVLLDACPHLQELTIQGCLLSYDVLLWIGGRCHALKTLILVVNAPAGQRYPSLFTPELWQRLSPGEGERLTAPALPLLSTLTWHGLALPHIRPLVFTAIASYLVRSAPSLRYLRLAYHEWLEEDRALLCTLGQLAELRGLWLGETGWMQQGALARYWMSAERSREAGMRMRVRDEEQSVWGEEALPRTRQAWDQDVRLKMRAGARREEQVWAGWSGPRFKDKVAGVRGARAFFTAISPHLDSASHRAEGGSRRTTP